MVRFYRGGEGMLSWALHRISGLGVLLFLALHIVDTTLVLFGPEHYNAAIRLYRHPAVRVSEVVLVAGVLYHALNGLRIIAIDFWPHGVRYQRQMWWAVMALFFVLFVPAAYMMLRPVFPALFGAGPGPLG